MGIAATTALSALTFLALLLPSPAKAATSVDTWAREIREASKRFAIPEQWIRDVMRVESDGRVRVNGLPITSPAGAMGLMQLMPDTWVAMRRAYGLGDDPYDPHDNILAGAAYLRAMYEDYGYPGALAAYNAGPGRFAEFLANGRPLPAETISYVERVVGRARSRAKSSSHLPSAGRSRKRPSAGFRRLFVVLRPVPIAAGSEISEGRDAQPLINGERESRGWGVEPLCGSDSEGC